MSVILAQEGIPVTVQLEQLAERLLTPAGIAVAITAISLGIALIAIRRLSPVLVLLTFVVSTFQANPRVDQNVLLGPFQAFRFISKPIGFIFMLIAIVFALGTERGDRRSTAGFASSAFLVFQCYYLAQLAVFSGEGVLKGAFGLLTAVATWVLFSQLLGKKMQDFDSAARALHGLVWVGTAFVAANLVQIVAGLGGALVGGRLAGIAGNAQMMGCMAAMLLLFNGYVAFERGTPAFTRTLSLVNCGFLAVLMLGTGSRTAMLATAVGMAIMFRTQIGKVALIAIASAAGVLAVSIVFSDVISITQERVMYGEDTRSAGWLWDLQNFYESPIVGKFPFLQPGEQPSGVESVFIRTLSSMGVIGMMVLLPVVISVAFMCTKAWSLMRISPDHSRLCSVFLAACAELLVFNTFDGYAFGLVTFPVLIMYATFTLGCFLREEESRVRAEGLEGWELAQA